MDVMMQMWVEIKCSVEHEHDVRRMHYEFMSYAHDFWSSRDVDMYKYLEYFVTRLTSKNLCK